MRRYRLGLVALLYALTSSGGPGKAADPALREIAALQTLGMFQGSGAPGMVVALVRGSESLVGGLGETAKGNGQEPTGRSVFRARLDLQGDDGEAAGRTHSRGSRRLSEPLQRFAPQGKTAPTLAAISSNEGGASGLRI